MSENNQDRIRDRLWAEVWTLEYRASYGHEASKFMVRRWMIMDLVSRLLTALFASSSAIAGWALWQNAAGKHVWIVLSGVTALVAILDGVLGSRDKLKRYAELSGSFVRLSQSLGGLLSDMRIDPNFDPATIRLKHDENRTRYAELFEQYPVDLFFTRKSENRVQEALNQKLEYATN